MAGPCKRQLGAVGWFDVTVDRAAEARAFYEAVVGWTSSEVDMGDYCDFAMHSPTSGDAVAGICHARGVNEALPRGMWIPYVCVEDVDRSARRCLELGGEVVVEPKEVSGQGRFCVLRDPFGAFIALLRFE